MRLTQAHLHLLCCPVCHADLAFAAGLTSEAAPQAIDCTGCGRRYPIVDELPVLLAERATLAAEASEKP